mmetsp:Transcript_38883/g.99321  ORF Transcript_38883/g.99321 Transcript_38883/m.99321 type:complete len:264 (+) Transcript_38883:782-1573(+)
MLTWSNPPMCLQTPKLLHKAHVLRTNNLKRGIGLILNPFLLYGLGLLLLLLDFFLLLRLVRRNLRNVHRPATANLLNQCCPLHRHHDLSKLLIIKRHFLYKLGLLNGFFGWLLVDNRGLELLILLLTVHATALQQDLQLGNLGLEALNGFGELLDVHPEVLNLHGQVLHLEPLLCHLQLVRVELLHAGIPECSFTQSDLQGLFTHIPGTASQKQPPHALHDLCHHHQPILHAILLHPAIAIEPGHQLRCHVRIPCIHRRFHGR